VVYNATGAFRMWPDGDGDADRNDASCWWWLIVKKLLSDFLLHNIHGDANLKSLLIARRRYRL